MDPKLNGFIGNIPVYLIGEEAAKGLPLRLRCREDSAFLTADEWQRLKVLLERMYGWREVDSR